MQWKSVPLASTKLNENSLPFRQGAVHRTNCLLTDLRKRKGRQKHAKIVKIVKVTRNWFFWIKQSTQASDFSSNPVHSRPPNLKGFVNWVEPFNPWILWLEYPACWWPTDCGETVCLLMLRNSVPLILVMEKSNEELDCIVVFRVRQQTFVNALSMRIIRQNQEAEQAEKSVADSA